MGRARAWYGRYRCTGPRKALALLLIRFQRCLIASYFISSIQNKLLTSRAIHAHCTFLSVLHLPRLASRASAIAHCPLSNAYFSSQPFALREALDSGLNVGLGTDVAGGYSADIMNAMRSAVVVARLREGERAERTLAVGAGKASGLFAVAGHGWEAKKLSIDWKEALYLATRGGAVALGLPTGAGAFERGAPFDAQLSRCFLINFHSPQLIGSNFQSNYTPRRLQARLRASDLSIFLNYQTTTQASRSL